MKYAITILILFKVVTSAGQYSIDRIFVDESISDTTYVKEETDSIFRLVGGVYVFSHLIGHKFHLPWGSVQGKPASFSPSAHSHSISEVTNLQSTLDGKQANLVSGTNIKTINGTTVLGSGDLVVTGGAATSTSGVGTSPTSSSTTTVTHNLGRTPIVIRIYGYGTFTSNAAATATTSSMGIFSSSGNHCVYQRFGAAITTTQAGLSSNTFAILLATGGGHFISGVIQNVDSDSFDIVWTESGTSTAQVFLWEAQ